MPARGIWLEQIDKRTRNGKKRVDSADPRHFAVDVTIGSIHYKDNPKDKAEQWKEIDNAFEPAPAPWDWQMLRAGYHIKVKEDFKAGQILEFEKQGETVQFQPMMLEWTNDLDQIQQVSMPTSVTPIVTNPEVDLLPAVGMLSHQGTIRWDDAYGEGLDFEWRCTSTRLIKILEVESFNKLPVPEQYILDGGNPVLRLNLIFAPSKGVDIYVDGEKWNKKAKKQTFNVIEFRKDGEVLWGFMPLRYWGSYAGKDEILQETNEGQSVATLEKRGNKLYISIRVPYDWLQSAVYPVFIDTDVDEQIDDDKNDGSSDNDGANSYANNVIDIGFLVDLYRDAGARFEGVIIPLGATIDTAYLSGYSTYRTSDALSDLYGEESATPEDFSLGSTIISARDRTTASIAVDNPFPGGAWGNFPGMKTIIIELTATYDYSSGADMTFLWITDHSSTGLHQWRDYYYGNHTYGTKLHIEYTTGEEPTEQAVGGGAITPTGALGLTTKITIGSGAITPSGALSTILRFLQAVGSGSITPVGALGRKITIAIGAGSITPVGVLGRVIKIVTGSGSITPSGILAKLPKIQVGEGAITPSGALSTIKRFLQAVGEGAITPSGVLGRIIKIAIGAGSVTPSSVLGRLIKITVGSKDTETLRPNATGDENAFATQYPADSFPATDHWNKVDETPSDEDSTYIEDGGADYGSSSIKISIRENGVTTDSGWKIITASYAPYSQVWAIRPSDSQPFTVGDINALQIGVFSDNGSQRDLFNLPATGASGTINSITVYAICKYRTVSTWLFNRCTQVYVEVDYAGGITPSGILGRLTKISIGAGAITPSGALSAIKRFPQSVGQGVITPIGTLGRNITIAVGQGVITPAGGILSRAIKIAVGAGSVTPTGALTTIKRFIQWVGAGTITPTGSLSTLGRWVQSVGQGVITPVGTLGRNIFIAVGDGTITPVGTLARKIVIAVGGGVITPIGILSIPISRFTQLVGQGSVAIAGSLGRFIKISVGGGTITPIGTLIADYFRKLALWLFHRAYRNVTVQARAYRDLSVSARAYRDLSVEVRG